MRCKNQKYNVTKEFTSLMEASKQYLAYLTKNLLKFWI